jgi:hypothetical protein
VFFFYGTRRRRVGICGRRRTEDERGKIKHTQQDVSQLSLLSLDQRKGRRIPTENEHLSLGTALMARGEVYAPSGRAGNGTRVPLPISPFRMKNIKTEGHVRK